MINYYTVQDAQITSWSWHWSSKRRGVRQILNIIIFNTSKTTMGNFERARNTKLEPPVGMGGKVLE